jgi:hypothetical protein
MLTGKIEFTGKTLADVELAIEWAGKQIADGFTSGFESNDSGAFGFHVVGDEDESAAV